MSAASPPVPSSADVGTARARLALAAFAIALIAVAMLATEPVVQAHPPLIIGNSVLLATVAAAVVCSRRARLGLTGLHVVAVALMAQMSGLTLAAFAYQPGEHYVVMLLVQCVGAALLFLSTRWLAVSLALTIAATAVVTTLGDRSQDGVLVATGAILSMTIHLALRDRERVAERAHAAALAAALAEAHQQLAAKERADVEREAAKRESERYQAQWLHAQKMEAIGTLAGGIAHDMNNALAAIVGYAECIADEAAAPEVRDDAEQILLAAGRAADLTRNLLGFSRRERFRRAPLRPESVITDVVKLVTRSLPKGVKVETSFAPELAAIDGDVAELTHALVNLCLNANHAMGGVGVLTLAARRVDLDAGAASAHGLPAGRYVALSVRDTGTGMDAATQACIFEPFFTTTPQGEGTGLGLAMVYAAIKRHDGAIAVDSALGRGTTFTLYLPAAADAGADADRDPPVTTPPLEIGGRILVVEDEAPVRAVVSRTLERAGFDVATAVDGRDGLAQLAQDPGRFDLMLLDMAMPVMAGPETFRRARALAPGLRVLLTSGYTAADDARALLAEGALGLLEKPCAPSDLVAAVAAAARGERVPATSRA